MTSAKHDHNKRRSKENAGESRGGGRFKNLFAKESVAREKNYAGGFNVLTRVLFLLLMLVIIANFAIIQVVKGDYYRQQANAQQSAWRTIPAGRGTILDTNGVELAVSVAANIVTVDPSVIKTAAVNYVKNYIAKPGDVYSDAAAEDMYRRLIARDLAELLKLDEEWVFAQVSADGRYKMIARKIETDLGDRIKAWRSEKHIKGVYVDEDSKRIYPLGRLASHVLGFTGNDDQGLVCGVEVALNKELTGTNGRIMTSVDAKGNELPYDSVRRIDAVKGMNPVLTLDAKIQAIAESALKQAIIDYNVIEGGAAIVMNAKNADVLAMASYPDFDLNDPYGKPDWVDDPEWIGNATKDVQILSTTVWRNKALTDTYEPGSTFKSISAAIGLEEGKVRPGTKVSDKPLLLRGWEINCWKKDGDHGEETFADAIKNSCNPILARLALDIGLESYLSYVHGFGFFDRTGITISGEAASIMHESPSDIDLAVMSFGQRFQITPIQMATAYCALANGGTLYKPRIVRELRDQDGITTKVYESVALRQVISQRTSSEMMAILEDVVASGTGSNAYVSGYRVAGKTGTSETLQTQSTGRYIASFIGIAPADDPEIVVLVMLDHPDVESGASGGRQAAPTVGKIIEKTLEYMGVARRYTELDRKAMMVKSYVPDVAGLPVEDARILLKRAGLVMEVPDMPENGDPTVVTVAAQVPEMGQYITDGSTVLLYTDAATKHPVVRVPDLTGYALADAYILLSQLGFNMHAENIGTVVSQSVEPGTMLERGAVIELKVENTNTESMG
ncbi:MAG: PASTA domain-containing protein [Clostridia bacterium]|nr:PASTA domain-containing protein [Clostridia bacterium]